MGRKTVSLTGDQSQGDPVASLSLPRAGPLKDAVCSGSFFRVLFNQLYIPTPSGQRELLLCVAQQSCLGYFRKRKLVLFYRDLKGSQGFYSHSSASNHLVSSEFCKYLKRKEIQLHSSEQKIINRNIEIHIYIYIHTHTMQHQHILDSVKLFDFFSSSPWYDSIQFLYNFFIRPHCGTSEIRGNCVDHFDVTFDSISLHAQRQEKCVLFIHCLYIFLLVLLLSLWFFSKGNWLI